MSTQLRIVWDGRAPGLEEGRLSLATFGPALLALLRAARNIARRQVAAATGESYEPEKATRSTLVDLQLSAFRNGSADSTLEVVPVASQFGAAMLFPDFPERVTRELFTSIRDESRGIRRDRFVNEFLRSLPKDLGRQRYSVIVNGREEEPLELTEIQLLEPVEAYPGIVLLRGQVEGVTFGERGEPQVRFAPWQGRLVTASATKEQVKQAVQFQEKAQALFLMGDRPRLLWIRSDVEQLSLLDAQQREDHIFSTWSELLGRLAK
jgi:hypothetical protein